MSNATSRIQNPVRLIRALRTSGLIRQVSPTTAAGNFNQLTSNSSSAQHIKTSWTSPRPRISRYLECLGPRNCTVIEAERTPAKRAMATPNKVAADGPADVLVTLYPAPRRMEWEERLRHRCPRAGKLEVRFATTNKPDGTPVKPSEQDPSLFDNVTMLFSYLPAPAGGFGPVPGLLRSHNLSSAADGDSQNSFPSSDSYKFHRRAPISGPATRSTSTER